MNSFWDFSIYWKIVTFTLLLSACLYDW